MHLCHSPSKLLCHSYSPNLNCLLFSAQRWLSTAPLWSASFLDRWLNGQIEKRGVKMIGHVSLIGKMEEKMCMRRYVWACTTTTVCLCAPERGRQARWGGALSLSVLYVLCECRREAVSDTLVCSLLAPLWGRSTLASPGESGGPLGTGQDREGGEGGQHGGQAFSHYEKERNQIQAKSPSIYCIPHLSRAASWKEIRGATVQWGGHERRGQQRCS